MLADLDLDFKFLRRCQRTRHQTQLLRFMQETDRPLPLFFIRNRQAGTDDNLAEAIARVRFTDGSLRFHFQVGVFEFRVSRDCVERRRKATRECSHQQVLRCPPAFETAELRWRGEMNCIRGRIGLGGTGLSGGPPSYNAVFMFIFHSVLRVLLWLSKNCKLLLRQPIPKMGISRLPGPTVPDDSVPADPVKRWPGSRLAV